MSTVPIPRGERLDELPILFNDSRAPGWWGMVGLIATEAMLFACLLASLFYLRATVGIDTVETAHPPRLDLPTISTVLLVATSLVYAWGERGMQQGRTGSFQVAAVVALLLAAGFLAVQGMEWSTKPAPTTDAYHSLYFAITGTHSAHVVAGLLLTIVTLVRVISGHVHPGRYLAVRNVGLYWHFVNTVWVIVFIVVYLWPHLY